MLISVNRRGSFLLRCEMLKHCKWREKSFVESIALVCHFFNNIEKLREKRKKKEDSSIKRNDYQKIKKMASNDNGDGKVYYTVISK